MKKIILLFSLILALCCNAQSTVNDTLKMNKTSIKRSITISLPASYQNDKTRSYPLLIVLDGDYLTAPFEGVLKYGNYWDDLPETIIVGLHQNGNGERYDDCKIDESTGLPVGKGEKFFEFIAGELLPFIQSKYRVGNFKIIAGHDVTAGFINLFLYKDQPLFNAYINLSPELATEMEVRIADRLAAQKQNIFYYLSSADGDIKKMRENIALLDTNLKSVSNPNLNYRYDEIKGASHYSLVLYSIPNALYQFFASYKPISTDEFQQKIVKLESGYVDYLKNKYEVLEKTIGIKMPIRVNDFKAIEAAILKNKAYNEFEQLAQLSSKSYPKAMLSEYHMARYYEFNGDMKRAVKSYQNAFSLEPIGDLTKDMMLAKADELRSQIKK